MDEPPFRDLFDRSFRWPRRGDEPLRKATKAHHKADLPVDAWERSVLLQSGFMRAGKLLVDSALAEPSLRLELTLPALYAYRHAIELGLKWTLVTYRQALDVDYPAVHATHSLKDLWDAFQRLLDAVSYAGEEEGNRAAKRVVMAFHEWDKQGDAFRYAVRTNGRLIPLREEQIDLVRLRDVMEGFANFLGGVDGALSAAG